VVKEGYKYMFDEESTNSDDIKQGMLVTVWSAPNYCYRCGNVASMLVVDENHEREFRIFKEVPRSSESIPTRQVVPYFV